MPKERELFKVKMENIFGLHDLTEIKSESLQ